MPTDTKNTIYARMAAILDQLPAIGKDARNPNLNFNYRSVDAILNELNPLLAKHGVFMLPEVTELRLDTRPTRNSVANVAIVTVAYHFTADDGTEVVATAVGEGQDSGDKAVSKAMTMALKTCLGQVFAISTDEDPDGETVPVAPAPARPSAARSERAESGTPPPAPPADPVGEPWMVTKARIDAFIRKDTPDWQARREQILVEADKAELPTDLAVCNENQLDAWAQIIENLTGNF